MRDGWREGVKGGGVSEGERGRGNEGEREREGKKER